MRLIKQLLHKYNRKKYCALVGYNCCECKYHHWVLDRENMTITNRCKQEAIQTKTIPDELKQKMWNALYAEEDKFEEKYIGTKNHDSWFLIYRPWLQAGFELAIKAITDYEDSVRNAPAVGGWISVKDRLPKDNTEVIIFVQHKIGWFRAFPLFMALAWHDAYGWHSTADEFSDGERNFITHWMPLPELPNEVSVDD